MNVGYVSNYVKLMVNWKLMVNCIKKLVNQVFGSRTVWNLSELVDMVWEKKAHNSINQIVNTHNWNNQPQLLYGL